MTNDKASHVGSTLGYPALVDVGSTHPPTTASIIVTGALHFDLPTGHVYPFVRALRTGCLNTCNGILARKMAFRIGIPGYDRLAPQRSAFVPCGSIKRRWVGVRTLRVLHATSGLSSRHRMRRKTSNSSCSPGGSGRDSLGTLGKPQQLATQRTTHRTTRPWRRLTRRSRNNSAKAPRASIDRWSPCSIRMKAYGINNERWRASYCERACVVRWW
jgi:hypothetical protein